MEEEDDELPHRHSEPLPQKLLASDADGPGVHSGWSDRSLVPKRPSLLSDGQETGTSDSETEQEEQEQLFGDGRISLGGTRSYSLCDSGTETCGTTDAEDRCSRSSSFALGEISSRRQSKTLQTIGTIARRISGIIKAPKTPSLNPKALPVAWPHHEHHLSKLERAMSAALSFTMSDHVDDNIDFDPVLVPEQFRLMDRDAPFLQSSGKMNIHRVHRDQKVLAKDVFHIFVEMPTHKLLSAFCLLYMLTFICFALIIWPLGDTCKIGCETFMGAMFLTVETMMTIGYGVPDPTFKDCPLVFIFLLITQTLVAVLYISTFTGILYQRVSRGGTRASTILFSDKAVLQTNGGYTYLMFQVAEMRRTQLLECHIRCYLYTRTRPQLASDLLKNDVNHELDGRIYSAFRQEPMRIDKPDDNLNSPMFPVLPSTVVHRIDAWSPILRNAKWPYGGHKPQDAMSRRMDFEPQQRSSETEVGVRTGCWCDVCGETFHLREQLRRHAEFYASQGDDPGHARMLETMVPDPSVHMMRKAIQDHLDQHDIEVVCILEGTDATTSAAVQARHSYTTDDMVWDHDFAPCVVEHEAGGICVDFAKFHDLVEVEAPRPEVRRASHRSSSRRRGTSQTGHSSRQEGHTSSSSKDHMPPCDIGGPAMPLEPGER